MFLDTASVLKALDEFYHAFGVEPILLTIYGSYAGSNLREVAMLLRVPQVRLRPGQRFVDLGAGDGRVVVLAGILGADAHGIEHNPEVFVQAVELTERALASLASVPGLPRFERQPTHHGVRWVRRVAGTKTAGVW